MHTFSTVLNTSLRGPPLPQRMAKKDGRPNREGMSQTEFQRKKNLFSCIQTFSDLLSAQTYMVSFLFKFSAQLEEPVQKRINRTSRKFRVKRWVRIRTYERGPTMICCCKYANACLAFVITKFDVIRTTKIKVLYQDTK